MMSDNRTPSPDDASNRKEDTANCHRQGKQSGRHEALVVVDLLWKNRDISTAQHMLLRTALLSPSPDTSGGAGERDEQKEWQSFHDDEMAMGNLDANGEWDGCGLIEQKAIEAVKAVDGRICRWMFDHGIATGHGDTIEALLDEIAAHLKSAPALGALSEEDVARAIDPPAFNLTCTSGPDCPVCRRTKENAREKARAVIALARTTDASGWRDIATAPRDGTRILLGWPLQESMTVVAHWERGAFRLSSNDEHAIAGRPKPQFWQPLHSPPGFLRGHE